MRPFIVAAAAVFAFVPVARSDIEPGTPELQGVLVSVETSSIQVRTGSAQLVTVAIRPGCAFFLGQPIAVNELIRGDVVAVSGLSIPVPGREAVVIGRSFMVAARGVAIPDREVLARTFLEAAFKDADPDHYERKVVAGLLERVEAGGFMTVRAQGKSERVKLGPEASGTILTSGSRSDLEKGRSVFMAAPTAGVTSVLLYR